MKKPLFATLLCFCFCGSLSAQSLLQSPFNYQYLGKKAFSYGWNTSSMLFRDDLATGMLLRSFSGQMPYSSYALVDNLPGLRTNYMGGLGSVFANGFYSRSLRFYSILGSDLSSANAVTFGRRFRTNLEASHEIGAIGEFHHNSKERDKNGDDFLDNPLVKNSYGIVDYEFNSRERFVRTRLSLLTMHENSLQGEKGAGHYDESLNNANSFRLEHRSNYYGARSNTDIRLNRSARNVLSFDIAGKSFRQESCFSKHFYEARQEGMYFNTDLASQVSPFITVNAGAEYRYDNKEEGIDSIRLGNRTNTVSMYLQNELKIRKHFSVLWNYRMNYNETIGVNHNATIKADVLKHEEAGIYLFSSFSSDFVSPVSENLQFLAGSRALNINENDYYQPDRFAKSGIALRLFKLNDIFNATFHYHYTYYLERSVLVFGTSPAAVNIYSATDGSYDHTFETKITIGRDQRFCTGEILYRFDDIKAEINGEKTKLPFYPRHNLLMNLHLSTSYRYESEIPMATITGILSSPMELPLTGSGGTTRAPAIFTLNTYVYFPLIWIRQQVQGNSQNEKKREALRWMDVMLGFENMTGYKQDNVLIRNSSQTADGYEGLNQWTPLSGFRFSFGIVLKPPMKN